MQRTERVFSEKDKRKNYTRLRRMYSTSKNKQKRNTAKNWQQLTADTQGSMADESVARKTLRGGTKKKSTHDDAQVSDRVACGSLFLRLYMPTSYH